MSLRCPSAESCPIFSGVLKGKEFTTAAYKMKYCESADNGHHNCRRWQVKQKIGKVPGDLLPNSLKTLDEICTEVNLDEI